MVNSNMVNSKFHQFKGRFNWGLIKSVILNSVVVQSFKLKFYIIGILCIRIHTVIQLHRLH